MARARLVSICAQALRCRLCLLQARSVSRREASEAAGLFSFLRRKRLTEQGTWPAPAEAGLLASLPRRCRSPRFCNRRFDAGGPAASRDGWLQSEATGEPCQQRAICCGRYLLDPARRPDEAGRCQLGPGLLLGTLPSGRDASRSWRIRARCFDRSMKRIVR